VNLRRADLRGTDFRGADLRVTDFRGADLRGTDFGGADLRGTDFGGADMSGMLLQGARVKGARGLAEAVGMSVVKVNPGNGEDSGDTLVTVKGEGFAEGAYSVTVGGVACSEVTRFDAQSLTCVTGAHEHGAVDVVVTHTSTGESATGVKVFVYRGPDVTLTGVKPHIGPMAGGTLITVKGTGFRLGNVAPYKTVFKIGAKECTSLPGGIENFHAQCLTGPSDDPGKVDVVATNSYLGASWSGRLDSKLPAPENYFNTFEYQKPGPVVDAVQPDEGSRVGGYPLTLTGSGFQMDNTGVTLSQTDGPGPALECKDVRAESSKSLKCDAPRVTSSGDYDVTVTNKDGQTSTLGAAFSYQIYDPALSGIDPAIGEKMNMEYGGKWYPTTVTITGDGFDSDSKVKVGNVQCDQVDVQTPKRLSCTLDPNNRTQSGPADVVITNPNGATDILAGAFTFGLFPLLYFQGYDAEPDTRPLRYIEAIKLNGSGQTRFIWDSGKGYISMYNPITDLKVSDLPNRLGPYFNMSFADPHTTSNRCGLAGNNFKHFLSVQPCWHFSQQMAAPKVQPQNPATDYIYSNVCGDGNPAASVSEGESSLHVRCFEGNLQNSAYFIYRMSRFNPPTTSGPFFKLIFQGKGKSGGITVAGDTVYWMAATGDTKPPAIWRSKYDGTKAGRWRDIWLPGVTQESLSVEDVNLPVAMQAYPEVAEATSDSSRVTSKSLTSQRASVATKTDSGGGIELGRVHVKKRKRALVTPVTWSDLLRDRKGRGHQFRVRLTMDADEGAPVSVVHAKSATLGRTDNDVKLGRKRVKIWLTKSQWKRLDSSDDAVMSVTQLYRRSSSAVKYNRGHTDVFDVKQLGRWTTKGYAPARSEGFRDCAARRLGRNMQLRKCDLAAAALSRMNLRGADLRYSDLEGADLRGADLRGADLRGANVIGVDLRGAQLKGAVGLDASYLYIRKADSISRVMMDNSREEEILVKEIPAFDREFEAGTKPPWDSGHQHATAPITTAPAFAIAGGYMYWISGSATEGCASDWCPGETWVSRAQIDGKYVEKKFLKIKTHGPVIAINNSVPSGPRILSVFPDEGPAVGGTKVSVVGSGFTEDMNVAVGGAGCVNIKLGSSQTLTCTTTRAQPGRSDVTAIPKNLQSWSLKNGFNYLAARPNIEDVSPGSGPDYGGTKIKIKGQNFLASAQITVGGEPCVKPDVSPGHISCTTPPHDHGVVNVKVSHGDGASSIARDAFRYLKEKRLFWVDGESPEAIGSSSVGGKDTKLPLIALDGFEPNAVVANEDYVYWSDLDTGSIGRADRDGGNIQQQFISEPIQPWHVTVTDTHIYWSDWRTEAIGRAALDGTDVDLAFVADVGEAVGLTANDTYLYWGNAEGNGSIGRVGLDGSDSDPDFISSDVGIVTDVAVNSTDLFWTTETEHRLGRINSQGSGSVKFINIGKTPESVTVDDEYVYWVNQSLGAIGRATVTGENVEQDFLSGLPGLLLSVDVS
jgi:virginiamycin B lyase